MDNGKLLVSIAAAAPIIVTAKQQEFRARKELIFEPQGCPGCRDNKNHWRCKDCNILMGPGHVEAHIAERCGSCLRARSATAA